MNLIPNIVKLVNLAKQGKTTAFQAMIEKHFLNLSCVLQRPHEDYAKIMVYVRRISEFAMMHHTDKCTYSPGQTVYNTVTMRNNPISMYTNYCTCDARERNARVESLVTEIESDVGVFDYEEYVK